MHVLFRVAIMLAVYSTNTVIVHADPPMEPPSRRPTKIVALPTEFVETFNYKAILQTASDDCWFGSIKCLDGSRVCINPIKYLGCTFDAISPIKLDQILPAIGDALQEFSDDPIKFVADFMIEEIDSLVNDFSTCVKGLSGQAPSCTELNTLKSCVSTALTGLGVAIETKVLEAAEFTRVKEGLSKMDDVLGYIDDQCKRGCDEGVCNRDTRTFAEPTGCKCQSLVGHTDDDYLSVTPSKCATNTALFVGNDVSLTSQDRVAKVEFTFMGCYVGKKSDPSSWSNCAAAYESSVFDDAMFVRCTDQYNQTLRLLNNDYTTTTTATTGSETSSAAIIQHIATPLTAALGVLVTALLLTWA